MTGNHILRDIQDILLPDGDVTMSDFNDYSNVDIDTIFPGPPCPPYLSYLSNQESVEYNRKMAEWSAGFEDWKKRRKENVIDDRFEILDL